MAQRILPCHPALPDFLVVFTMPLLTDNIHHLLYPNPHLSTDYPFPELKYDFTIIIYLFAILYVYGANLYGLGLLIKRAVQLHNIYLMQFLVVIMGLSIPLVLSIFALLNIRNIPQRDNTPFALAIGNLIWVCGQNRQIAITS